MADVGILGPFFIGLLFASEGLLFVMLFYS